MRYLKLILPALFEIFNIYTILLFENIVTIDLRSGECFELRENFSKRNHNFPNSLDKVQYCSTYRYHLYFSAPLPALRPSVLCRVPSEVGGLRPHRPPSPGMRRLSHTAGPKLGSILLHRTSSQQGLTKVLCQVIPYNTTNLNTRNQVQDKKIKT